MRFIVYGAGAVGGSVAAHLRASGHEVLIVARGQHLQVIREKGLRLATPSRSQRLAIPTASSIDQVRWQENDVVLLAMKSQDTYGALRALRSSPAPPDTPVVCMQNGVANEPAALRWFSRVYGIVVMLPATFLEPGVVAVHSSPVPGLLDIGRWPAGIDGVTRMVGDAMNSAGFNSHIVEDVARWKYAKLISNLSNVVVALCGQSAVSRSIVELARDEGRRCLDLAGIGYASDEEVLDRRNGLVNVQPADGQRRQGNSSWQSLARGTGNIEADFLNGEIVLLGRLHEIATPVNNLLQALAREYAQDRRPPGSLDPEEILARLD